MAICGKPLLGDDFGPPAKAQGELIDGVFDTGPIFIAVIITEQNTVWRRQWPIQVEILTHIFIVVTGIDIDQVELGLFFSKADERFC